MICPCCNQPVEGVSPHALLDIALTNQEKIVLEQLINGYPRRVARDHLIDAIYGDRADGGALTAPNVISVLIGKIRKKVEPHGWTIPCSKGGTGHYGAYSIEPLDNNFIPLSDAVNNVMVGINRARKSKSKPSLIRYAGAE